MFYLQLQVKLENIFMMFCAESHSSEMLSAVCAGVFKNAAVQTSYLRFFKWDLTGVSS